MNHDTAPIVIGDYKDKEDVGPFVPEGEENYLLIPILQDFLENGKWEMARCRCHVYCLLCNKEISNIDFHGYGFHIRHGYLHYLEDHRVALDKDLAKLAIKYFRGEI